MQKDCDNPIKLHVAAHPYNPSTGEVEARESEVQVKPEVYLKFTFYLKKKNGKVKEIEN